MATTEAASPEALRRALDYPYEIPRYSYVFDPTTGDEQPLPDPLPDAVWANDRTPVLAVGSNASPTQLARKFGNAAQDLGPVFAVLSRIREHDVVYAARVSSYGAVPAMLIESPGTSVDLHITFLTPRQRKLMDRSEGPGYALHAIPADFVAAGAPLRDELVTYAAVAGPLRVDGAPIALAAVQARARRFREWDQAGVLEHVTDRCGLAMPIWLGRVLTDRDYLQEMRDVLPSWSKSAE